MGIGRTVSGTAGRGRIVREGCSIEGSVGRYAKAPLCFNSIYGGLIIFATLIYKPHLCRDGGSDGLKKPSSASSLNRGKITINHTI